MATRKNSVDDRSAARSPIRTRSRFVVTAVFAHLAIFGNMAGAAFAQAAQGSLAPGWVDVNSFEAWRPEALLKRAVAAPGNVTCPAGRDALRLAVVAPTFVYDAGAPDGLWTPDPSHEDLMAQDADERRALRARLAPMAGAPDLIGWMAKLDPGKAYAIFCYPRLGDAQPMLGPSAATDVATATGPKGFQQRGSKGVEPTFIWYARPGALSVCRAGTSGARYDYDKVGRQVWVGMPVETAAICSK